MKSQTTRKLRDEAKTKALRERAEMYDRKDKLDEEERKDLEAHDAHHRALCLKYGLKPDGTK